jgi:hypothetical protein
VEFQVLLWRLQAVGVPVWVAAAPVVALEEQVPDVVAVWAA